MPQTESGCRTSQTGQTFQDSKAEISVKSKAGRKWGSGLPVLGLVYTY